ncbi:MAG: protein-ADP-ribose hydrolase [Selenomonadaceae bacterium]|nr:protein-ADP-ribose hydrolase [Selenomonadaceae bacterium]
MNKLTAVKKLNAQLLAEMPELEVSAVPDDLPSQRKLLRALMNVRPPMPLDADFLKLQDEILSAEVHERGIVKLSEIPSVERNIKIWQGDITRLEVDAIVNAANSALLGCFVPLHGCIDNAIHSAAGLQLRDACNKISSGNEPTGCAKITPAFNLPSKFVIHTVGPIIYSPPPSRAEENLLASCYKSCLELAAENNLRSIAFCCISTGEFHFPNKRAAEIAVETVRNFPAEIAVVFNVFKDLDAQIYRELLC